LRQSGVLPGQPIALVDTAAASAGVHRSASTAVL
jgi:hypothetical protein